MNPERISSDISCRKFDVPIDVEEYKAWKVYKANKPTINGVTTTSKQVAEPSPSSFSEVPAVSDASATSEATPEVAPPSPSGPQYPTSFAHVVELISTGKPIPGIKQIPTTVLEGQSSESTKPKRRKPWEKDDSPATASESTASIIAT